MTGTINLITFFEAYRDDFEFTANGVFRKALPPLCPDCSTQMVHNGYNYRCKDHLGTVKVGRYLCPSCRKTVTEDGSFWGNLTGQLFGIILFGDKATHQLCLLHLNKLIVNDFPKNTTIEQEMTKYELLNIFYNREFEIEFLLRAADEEQSVKTAEKGNYKRWLREVKPAFRINGLNGHHFSCYRFFENRYPSKLCWV